MMRVKKKMARNHKRGDIREDGYIFSQYKKKKDGGYREIWLNPDCFKKISEDSRKRNLEKYRLNPEKIKQRSREWHHKNKEISKQKSKSYYHNVAKQDMDKLREKSREQYKKHKERKKIYSKEYRKANRHKKAERESKRRLLINSSQTGEYNQKIIHEIYKIRERVSFCLGVPHHVDHIYPLSKGGLHIPENLQVIPAVLNLKKGDRISLDSKDIIGEYSCKVCPL